MDVYNWILPLTEWDRPRYEPERTLGVLSQLRHLSIIIMSFPALTQYSRPKLFVTGVYVDLCLGHAINEVVSIYLTAYIVH